MKWCKLLNIQDQRFIQIIDDSGELRILVKKCKKDKRKEIKRIRNMIVVCKNKKILGKLDEYRDITIGKKYISLTDFYDRDFMIELVDNSGLKLRYPKDNFSPLEVERERKLNELGI